MTDNQHYSIEVKRLKLLKSKFVNQLGRLEAFSGSRGIRRFLTLQPRQVRDTRKALALIIQEIKSLEKARQTSLICTA